MENLLSSIIIIMQQQSFERPVLTLLKYNLILLVIVNNVCAVEMACDRSRQLFNYTWGIISHGPSGSNYTQDSHCEWLIKVPNKKYITLIFHFMGTECSYDYLFVYNGDTLNSQLLGSFSGKSDPQQITSDSGSMLILLYSDANYVLGGFKAEYFVSDCPRNCTNHGVCTDNKCKCNDGWKGLDCSFPVCPNDCGSNLGRGLCIQSKCKCSDGFSGQACDLYKKDSLGNSWHWLSSEENGPPKRAAHTAVYVKESDSLYIFGGYDLNKILGDFYSYDFNTSTWLNEFTNSVAIMEYNENHKSEVFFEEILGDSSETNWNAKANEYIENLILSKSNVKTKEHQLLSNEKFGSARTHKRDMNRNLEYSEEQKLNDTPDPVYTKKDNKNEFPSPRYGHAACRYPGGFVIYGGKISKGNLSDELWFYNITSKKWSIRAKFSNLVPPKLTRHTITLVRKNLLYLFGGSTVDGEFSSKIYSIQLNSDEKQEQWEYVRSRGGKEFDVRLVAHVAVYYSKIDSLIVYGGIAAGLARLSKLSDKMFSFQISSRYWSEIHYPRYHLSDSFVPRERAFHSGVIVGSYLVIFGGYSHRHNKEEICYDNQMYLYHLGCHTWISRDVLGLDSERSKTIKPRGVFAHASDVRNGNTLLIYGGYHGNVNADFKAYVLPPTLASREGEPFEPDAICGRYRSLHECTSNPECGWCSADDICYGRTVGINCTTNLQTTRCPGLCPSLGDCHSCLLHGELSLHSNKAPFTVAQKLKLSQCTWCVQNARCHHKEDNFGVCGLRDDTPLQATTSWWGSQGTEITSVEECRTKDRRPGLTFIKYKHPINKTQPDAVTIVNATTVDFEVPSRDSRLDTSGGGSAVVTRFLGFLRIPNDWANGTENLKMCTSFSSAILRLSRNNFSSNLEVVSNVSTETTTCRTAHWASGSSVILRPGRYLVDFESKKSLNSGTSSFVPSKMVLMHNRSSESGKVFTFEYLEPYENGSCSSYSNCLHCLTDTRCGWCELNQKCLLREADETLFCSLGKENWSYLILQPSTCINCFNYVSCESCVSSPSCEWWIDDARCSRRGTALVGSFSVQAASECPTPCHLRSNCEQCLDEKGRCVWCDATKECFSFSVYTSEYQFGMCREWVDQSYSGQNNLLVPYGFESSNITHRSGKCKNCSKNMNCSSCLKALSCGWCYELENPINGLCVAGDFNSPKHDNCVSYLSKVLNTSLDRNETGWSYASCPDVDECDLALDDCHPDATCKNTYGSYICTCKRGFQGDGRLSCTKTCYNDCVHGTCSMAPDYRCECHLGWTGEDCGINCGCNNHSTCNKKVGVCDECQEWTTGEFCQYCKSGSYGNATSEENCRECECNGHGDAERGFCDSRTGTCFCKDNTTGKKCEKCMSGFYGNPENGGICYFECKTRGVIADFKGQGLGSFRSHLMPRNARLGSASPKECLWVLKTTQFTNSTQRSLIQLTINGDINVKCQDNSVFVYEGFPDLVSLNSQNHALGTFCQREDKATLTVETKAGTLTVLYRRGNKSEGFNATYKVFTCPDNCPSNRICIQNECLCRSGWTGPNCSLPICRNNCSSQVNQGFCYRDYGRCNCKPGFGGGDCSVKTTDHQIVFTELFNSIKISGSLDHLRKMIPRFGHSLVIDRRGSLWMFGGYSPSHGPLNDIRLFDTKNNTWVQVTVDSTRDVSMPQGRYFHASEIVNSRREIYVFGGIGRERGDILRDFWKFSIKHQRWVDVQTLVSPPPVAGHTLTLMKDSESENLILIGGVSPRHGFLNKIWSYNMEIEQWTTLTTIGKGPFGIFGHTTVYHGPTLSFYVYGGFLLVGNRRIHSNRMYSFHHPTKIWSPLPTFEEYNPSVSNLPQPRFLHSAITTKDYMLVFGGKILRKSSRSHFSDLLIAYSYGCNQWIRLLYKGAPIVGSMPSLTFGQAMAHDEETGAVYVVGGFDNVIHSEVTRIDLPSDLCNLWEGKEKCRSFLGCSFCSVTRPDKTLKSYCYSSSKSLKESCDYYNGTLITNNGVVCDAKWFQQRSCEHFKSCEDCLAKWPIYMKEHPVCKWCGNCSRERCVSVNQTCKIEGTCENVTINDHCNKYSCLKSDHSGQFANGSCSEKKLGATYLPTCSDFKNCTSCLSQQCKWSTVLRECISSDFQPLFCAGGICGLVLNQEDVDQCPEPCSAYDQCATCLKNSRCGWCSKSSGNYSGEGVCTEGSLDQTFAYEKNMCSTLLSQPNELVSWDYTSCPWENECANGHHTCDPVSEVCEDLPDGFRCVCGPGYKSLEFSCDPICSQGCLHGKCVLPEKCLCDFGYVGTNCSFQCQCNGHSNCLGPDRLGECLECHNNTKGAQCEHCKPLFVGDPTNNGTCLPCFEYCNRHTNVCVNDSSKQLLLNKSISELISMLEEGPKANALCIGCLNNTTGRKCGECIEGFFRGSEDLTRHCRPCECHGHGDRCDPVTGEKCNCGNNTESECQATMSKNSNQQCWTLQCSKCKETYSGTPTDGHQCYKQMTLDQKFCINSKLIEECKTKPKPLQPGQAAFFQVQPRYVNVDIRVFIDVLEGSLDMFMSLRDDSLVVTTNASSGQHLLKWDPKYKKRSAWSDGGFKTHSVDLKVPSVKRSYWRGNESFLETTPDGFLGVERDGEGLTTYITINKRNSFLQIRNIRGRLVLTLPKDKFDLITTRFYLGLVASTSGTGIAPTYGILFFRQDQLHIDLFVFFSVFFSCFFLFLAACVIAWKAKQAADLRRARRRHVVEMLHMAKRPFAKIVIQLEKDDPEGSSEIHGPLFLHRKRNKCCGSVGETRPVAVEPTSDGVAAIATFLVRLPGGSEAPVQLCLASSLILISRACHLNSKVFLRRRSSHHGAS